ncbi:hypothetical protein Vretimale_1898 [Volvox reticuliferus]|nr:hypothetical protein Vretimale_1898 [Volvox reticuliferus]
MMTTSHLQLVAFLLLGMSYSVASFSRKTACPHKEGFEWRSDIRWVGGIGSTTTTHSSLSAAEEACRNDASCTAFNNLGEVLRGNINSLSVNAFTGTCVYLKLSDACPQRPGYKMIMHASWLYAAGGQNVRANPASDAPALCDADSSCVAFNKQGDMLTGVITKITWSYNNCAYLKISALGAVCPPLYGYEAKLNTEVSGADAIAGAVVGALLDANQVQEACKINPKCTAWDSHGHVVIGGIDSYNYVLGTCAYIKNPCTPRAGFIAYSDLTFDTMTPPDDQFPELCGNDIYTKCLNDPTCQGFNTLRNIWTSVRPMPVTEYSGMCTYVRAIGF